MSLDENVSQTSDYVLRLGDGVSVDAEKMGNEARFLNDFRNTGKKPNVQFEFHVDEKVGISKTLIKFLSIFSKKKHTRLKKKEWGFGFFTIRLKKEVNY